MTVSAPEKSALLPSTADMRVLKIKDPAYIAVKRQKAAIDIKRAYVKPRALYRHLAAGSPRDNAVFVKADDLADPADLHGLSAAHGKLVRRLLFFAFRHFITVDVVIHCSSSAYTFYPQKAYAGDVRIMSLADYFVHIGGIRLSDMLAYIEHAEYKLTLTE